MIHVAVTLLLLGGLFVFGVLVLTGTIEVRFPSKQGADRQFAIEQKGQAGEKPAGLKARLLVVRGAMPGMYYPVFEGTNVIGRADQKPVEIDLEVQESPDRIWSSRQHAVITSERGLLFIEDLNSKNGTYVNRNRVPPGAKLDLKADNTIQIGEMQLRVQM